ncbi:MAG: FtsB family cell division protein [Actinomycetota bacterium]
MKRLSWPEFGRGPQVVAILLACGLMGSMLWGPTQQLLIQKQRLAEMSNEKSRVESTNEKLESRIERLKDPDFVEQQAREQAGLVRPGETLYITMQPTDTQKKRRKAERRATRKAAPPESEPGLIESFISFLGI